MDQHWWQDGLKDIAIALIVGAFAWTAGVLRSNWRKVSREEHAALQRQVEELRAKHISYELAQTRIESKLDGKLETIFSMLRQIEHQLERMQPTD